MDFCSNSGNAIGCLWQSLDWLSRADLTFLFLMLANMAVIVYDRLHRYRASGRQTGAFIHNAASGLRNGNFDDVIAVAARSKRSHVASVVTAGLTAFVSAPAQFVHAEAIEVAERALQRSRKTQTANLSLGLGTLATIASSAPFIGLLGTVFGILNAFRGVGMEKAAWLAMTAFCISQGLATTAMGLVVAVPAVWCHNYFRTRVEGFKSEMSNAALETTTFLNAHPEWRSRSGQPIPKVSDLFLDTPDAPRAHTWEVPYDHQRALLSAMWCCALYLAFFFARGMYWSYVWQHSYEQNSPAALVVDGQELISPDHRFRAVIPSTYFYRENAGISGQQWWSCASNKVELSIVPNDRPLAWRNYTCGERTEYALEQDEALQISSCNIPVIMWRNSNELVVQCANCSSHDTQLIQVDMYPGMTVLGSDGKRIHPQIAHPQPQCVE
jgi:biopolymer transport protein ExbB/biopolymer transport protein TolQ